MLVSARRHCSPRLLLPQPLPVPRQTRPHPRHHIRYLHLLHWRRRLFAFPLLLYFFLFSLDVRTNGHYQRV